MSLEVTLLRSSFAMVVERQPEITLRFYEILFQRYPDLEALFDPGRRQAQSKMLAEALGAVLEHLEDGQWMTDTLAGLGVRHIDYGVTPPMYDQVNECLRAALAEAAGSDWTDELDRAWLNALNAVRDLMLQGAARTAKAS